jgi:hypothetical protein
MDILTSYRGLFVLCVLPAQVLLLPMIFLKYESLSRRCEIWSDIFCFAYSNIILTGKILNFFFYLNLFVTVFKEELKHLGTPITLFVCSDL